MQWGADLLLQVKQPEQGAGGVVDSQLSAPRALLPGRWALYEASIAGDGSARILRDGVVVAEGRLAVPVAAPRLHAWAGRSFYAADPFWRGAIAELRVYPRCLTPAESAAAPAGFAPR